MRVTIKLFAGFRKGRFVSEVYEFTHIPTVSQAVERVNLPEPEIGILLCNSRHVELDCRLEDGDILSVFPKVGGG